MSISHEATLREQALSALRRRGNPFRQQFARNSDDVVCSRYHVPDLFATERSVVEDLIETYRDGADRPTAVTPILGARGAGKTHLLHRLKHGPGTRPRLFVTPGTFRVDSGGPDSSFLEYLLYQLINVLLAGGEQRGARPLDMVGEQVTRTVLSDVIDRLDDAGLLELAPISPLARFGVRLGFGRAETIATLRSFGSDLTESIQPCRSLAQRADLEPERLAAAVNKLLDRDEPRDLKGRMRQRIIAGFVRATLLDDEADLADFLTDGFTDVPFVVRPTRSQLTLSLLKALSEVIVGAGIPVVAAFDQLEELLYGQTDEEIRRASDAFFGGLVQVMSEAPGLCVLLFVEEGLWNRIVPPLPSHILDRIHEPIHLPRHGTVRQVRLNKPTSEQLVKVVSRRVRHTLLELPERDQLPEGFPFGHEFLADLAKRETVLRLMLQGCCNRLDEVFAANADDPSDSSNGVRQADDAAHAENASPEPAPIGAEPSSFEGSTDSTPTFADLQIDWAERWRQEVRVSERKIKSVGSLAGATAELHGGLSRWLAQCKALGVEQDHWRMTDLKDRVRVGDHPTYGTLTVVEWTSSIGDRRRVGIGLWLGRGVGKPRDLEAKLQAFESTEASIDHLILFRPTDDPRLSGKTLEAWDQAQAAGHSVRVEPVESEIFAKLHAYPRWMQEVSDAHADGAVPEELYRFLAAETEPIMRRLALPGEAPPARKAG